MERELAGSGANGITNCELIANYELAANCEPPAKGELRSCDK